MLGSDRCSSSLRAFVSDFIPSLNEDTETSFAISTQVPAYTFPSRILVSVPEPKSRHSKISGLQHLPSSILSLLISSLLSILLLTILHEPFKWFNRPSMEIGESVDSFLTRQFGETFARRFGSASVHGMYATDFRKLSVRAAFPTIWDVEERGRGSITREIVGYTENESLLRVLSLGLYFVLTLSSRPSKLSEILEFQSFLAVESKNQPNGFLIGPQSTWTSFQEN